MTAESWLRLALVPLAVLAASLAARRWGHAASGYLGGLPLIGGPITLFLALDHGHEFAARSALFTLAAIAAQAAHLTAIAHVGRSRRWPTALLAGWTSFAAVACAIAWIEPGVAMAAALAVGSLLAAWRWMPIARGLAAPPTIPAVELQLRVVGAFVLAAAILWSAPHLGPVASGVLLSLPITGSILPPFTLALHGPDALARLTRGFVVGLSGFTAFFLVVTTTLAGWGVTLAFGVAVGAALAAVFLAGRLVRPRR